MRLPHLIIGVSLAALAYPVMAQTTATTSTTMPDAPQPTMTLREAMVLAYNTNPDLAAERANLRATDENVPIARASGLPGVSATGGVNQSLYNTDQGISPSRRGTIGADLSVPVYSGGSVRNSVRGAETRVEAGRAALRAAESELFVQVVTVYVDVIRDEAIVRLNQQNVHVLEVNLQATRDRFEVGDLTRTDVAQSEARLALAQAQLRGAEARLIGSRENFIRVVGVAPGVLAPPPPLPGLPASVQDAVQVALANNPNLLAAQKQSDASVFDVNVARAGRLPRVSVGVGTDYYNYLGSVSPQGKLAGFGGDGFATSVGVNLTVPLFQGGRPAAQVRQAQSRRSAAMENVTFAERGVIAQARSQFAIYQSSLRVIESSRVAVDANRLSLEGVRAENGVGTRTILDILNAEQEFLNSQVQYVTAERDAYVAGFTLLAVMGKAEAEDLGLDGGPLYNPVEHYDRVNHSWSDWSDGPDATTTGTRTNETPYQNPDVTPGVDPLLQRPVDSTGTNP
ncbi:TolC family outer membrane protein [Sphingomonas sp. LB-2]|uniref:TolC family outer membrane protein n=1 Tax=Sphingomonas caeni TaxID=2984949 RepID=UPI00222F67B7|nr:TolC family outer membrane protein [Sphingomonas caeni]MCW3847682.1 TolC family outer membrane protein [Sphingomonas caeni]